jgi:hypothetical protein
VRETGTGATGGFTVNLRNAGRADAVWSEIEAALARLRVAVLAPGDRALDSRQVEVRSRNGRLLRPSG